jgi:hypothetical protein
MARYNYWMVYLPEEYPSSFLLFVRDSTGANKLRCYSSGRERVLGQPGASEIWAKTKQGVTRFETDAHAVSDAGYWHSKTRSFNERYLQSSDLSTSPSPEIPAPARIQQSRDLIVRGRAEKGSRRQIQDFVNANPAALERAIVNQLPEALRRLTPEIRWVSPRAAEDYREYRDADFLQRTGVGHVAAKLRDFWPQRGPSWDALGIISDATGTMKPGVIMVEAKSHIAEIYGNGCEASEHSRRKILSSLREVQRWCAAEPEMDWLGPLYQSANRIAHLYFLLERCGIPAWLVNVYFINDPYRPTALAEWEGAVKNVKTGLGVRGPVRNAMDLYLPAFSGA